VKARTKIALSIVISIFLFTLFIFFSFSGGFSYIESNFYSKKVSEDITSTLDSSILLLKKTHDENEKILSEILKVESVSTIFNSNFSSETIIARDKLFKELNRSVLGFDSVRIISLDGKRIQYSNIPNDIKDQNNQKLIYKNLNQVEEDDFYESVQLLDTRNGTVKFLEDTNQFLYILPFFDKYSQNKGIALFYVSCSGFKYTLSQAGYSSSSEEAFIVGAGGVLFNLTRDQFDLVKEDVNKFWSKDSTIGPVHLSSSDDKSYILFSVSKDGVGTVGRIVDSTLLELSSYMKSLLLITMFVVIMFVNFVLLNLRQDREVILLNRIKRFQIRFLQDYVENKGELDWARWQDEINSRKKLVHKELIKNLGVYGKTHGDEVDKLINSGWDDIIEVISSKINKNDEVEKVQIDSEQIESILERVLAKGVTVKGFGAGVSVPATHNLSMWKKSKS